MFEKYRIFDKSRHFSVHRVTLISPQKKTINLIHHLDYTRLLCP